MKLLSTLFIALCGVASASAAAPVAPYGIFEWQNKADNRLGLNHFTDTKITMKVVRRGTTDTISVGGFYDGRSRLKARYMPETPGDYDYVKSRTLDQWNELIERVDSVDPSGHLLSIHGSTATYFPHHPALTHASIQDEAPVMEPGRAAILWSVYKMPVVMDEVCYEGNLASRWGRMSGEEMVHRIWNGLMGGIYVTHGECIRRHTEGTDTIMWAEGGAHRGESWKRIGFARDILSSMGGELRPADVSRDIRVSVSRPGHYLVYFGKEMPAEWEFDLPARCDNFAKLAPGTRLKAEIIDTWNLTVTPVEGEFVTAKADSYRLRDQKGRKIRLPLRPYMMIRLTPADGESIPLTFTFHDENEN